MTLKDERDIQQDEYINDIPALKGVAYAKTAGGAYVEVLVDATGQLQ